MLSPVPTAPQWDWVWLSILIHTWMVFTLALSYFPTTYQCFLDHLPGKRLSPPVYFPGCASRKPQTKAAPWCNLLRGTRQGCRAWQATSLVRLSLTRALTGRRYVGWIAAHLPLCWASPPYLGTPQQPSINPTTSSSYLQEAASSLKSNWSIFEAHQKFHQHTLESLDTPRNSRSEWGVGEIVQGLMRVLSSNAASATS